MLKLRRILAGVVVAAVAVGMWIGLSSIAGRPKPPRFVRVPDLLGVQGEVEIRATLRGVGLQLGVVRQTVRNRAPPGTVTGQEPDAGTVVPYLSTVDVVVSAVPTTAWMPSPSSGLEASPVFTPSPS